MQKDRDTGFRGSIVGCAIEEGSRSGTPTLFMKVACWPAEMQLPIYGIRLYATRQAAVPKQSPCFEPATISPTRQGVQKKAQAKTFGSLQQSKNSSLYMLVKPATAMVRVWWMRKSAVEEVLVIHARSSCLSRRTCVCQRL